MVVGQQSVNERNSGKVSPAVRWLLCEHGPLLSSRTVAKILGFSNTDALRQARLQQRLPVQMFVIQGRRGWFASTAAVGEWIEQTIAGADHGTRPIRDHTERATGSASSISPSMTSEANSEPRRVADYSGVGEVEP